MEPLLEDLRSRPPLLCLREAGQITGISSRLLLRLVRTGDLRAVQPSGPQGRVLVVRDDLIRLLVSRLA